MLKSLVRVASIAALPLLAAASRPAAPICPVGEPTCAGRSVVVKQRFGVDLPTFERQLAHRFNPPPPPPPAEIADQRAGQVADARYFEAFPDFDRSYSPSARKRAKQLARVLSHEAAGLSHEQFVLHVAEITALAGNAHTAIGEDAFRKGTPRIPVRTFWFADGLRILRAAPAQADLLGARIDRIDGHPVQAVYAGLSKFVASPDARKRLILLSVLESPALLQAADLSPQRDRLTLEGVLSTGQAFKREIVAEKRDRAAPVSNTMRLLFPAPAGRMAAFLKPGMAVPLSLADSDHLFTQAALPNDGLYVGLTANSDSDDQPLSKFLSDVLARVARNRPRYIVLDMRMNSGGDYTKTYDFARTLPAASGHAHIFVLTSPWTFSAAITTVAALKEAGGPRVAIVGEAVGDDLRFWSEGGAFVLPNSGITAYFTTGRHDYQAPCTDRQRCFWLNEIFPVRVKSLRPDVSAPLTFEAYSRGIDPALNAVAARVGTRR